ncbi:MAG: hypothetical protein JSS44_01060 [Proteobacteria bacterium]|nr:hypothetical protein [Pseudomonadota bacterium]
MRALPVRGSIAASTADKASGLDPRLTTNGYPIAAADKASGLDPRLTTNGNPIAASTADKASGLDPRLTTNGAWGLDWRMMSAVGRSSRSLTSTHNSLCATIFACPHRANWSPQ